jgi:hypothetical protein
MENNLFFILIIPLLTISTHNQQLNLVDQRVSDERGRRSRSRSRSRSPGRDHSEHRYRSRSRSPRDLS